ncbi:hypothetical protein LWC34_16610 [Kibdelosporangium philippinense]|uniref:Uncharacterized protein n=1 Tax=Kibdelosporangium philippinense TaxID=211113 RepID=A0ABS8Z983_9PSEU|nr:hypothetical protein [Kibdelosporangium philippinense]MCE7004444.1 hypothetical protein [Kibdelosporangium philippinense]
MLPDDDVIEVLLAVLKKTAAAHGEYEESQLGGEYDEEWPEWYAEHMAQKLRDSGYRIVRSPD